jgi:hypothetical protein
MKLSESGASDHSIEEELNAEKFFKEKYNLEINFQELQETRTTK